MTILFTALAIAAAPASVQPAPAATHGAHGQHSQHAQQSSPSAKSSGDGCPCCKDMAGGGKMDCCAKHGEGHGADHSSHSAKR
jgi:hypothetical protein